MKNVLEYLKDSLSFLGVLIFQAPNKRFDETINDSEIPSNNLTGAKGIVVKPVSLNDGKIKYSGATWNARLEVHCSEKIIEKGKTVKIISASGNSVLVTDQLH